jgi:hypothetical protein
MNLFKLAYLNPPGINSGWKNNSTEPANRFTGSIKKKLNFERYLLALKEKDTGIVCHSRPNFRRESALFLSSKYVTEGIPCNRVQEVHFQKPTAVLTCELASAQAASKRIMTINLRYLIR